MKSKTKESTPVTPEWQRLYHVIKKSGMSVNAFALHIGLLRSENLYQIKKGNHGISKQLATLVNKFYPEYSVGWLLSGENPANYDIFLTENGQPQERIIKLPIYSKLVGMPGNKGNILDRITYAGQSLCNSAEFGLINTDSSLAPDIPVGTLLLLRPFNGSIIFGEFYLIVTEDYTLIRKIRSTPKPGEYRLESSDPENYDDMLIPAQKITNLFSVERVIK